MSIKGKNICFSGTLSKSRKEMHAEAEAAGAKAVTGISGTTDYLVLGEQEAHNAQHKKYIKAVEKGVDVLSESEYRKLLGKGGSAKKATAKKATTKKATGKKKATAKKATAKKATAKKATAKKASSSKATSFYSSHTKARLTDILDDLKDDTYRSSWTKSKLVTQLLTYGLDDVLGTFTSNELKDALSDLDESTSGNKSARLERLKEALS